MKVIHDSAGHMLKIWFDDPSKEHVCEETTDEVVLMKDVKGKIMGFELLHYETAGAATGMAVETVVRTGT